MKVVTKEQAEYLRKHNKNVYITIVNKRHCKRKKRYVEMTDRVIQLLKRWEVEHAKKVVEEHFADGTVKFRNNNSEVDDEQEEYNY